MKKFNQQVAQVVSDAGADFLIVHGRHWSERYETSCRYDDIRFFVTALDIPVIGNGDIQCVDSLQTMFKTGCAGVMISRAGVGQPWLIGELVAQMRQEKFVLPSIEEIGAIFMEHISQLIVLLGSEKLAILQARRFAKYYARRLPQSAAFCAAIHSSESWADFKINCLKYFSGGVN